MSEVQKAYELLYSQFILPELLEMSCAEIGLERSEENWDFVYRIKLALDGEEEARESLEWQKANLSHPVISIGALARYVRQVLVGQ